MMTHPLSAARETPPDGTDPIRRAPRDQHVFPSPCLFLSAPSYKAWRISEALREPDRRRFLVGSAAETLGVRPTRIRTGQHVWQMRHGQLFGTKYPEGLPEVMAQMTGFALVIPASRFVVGAGIIAELSAAETVGLPAVAMTIDGDVSPIDHCTVEPLTEDECRPLLHVARFVMPDGGSRLSEVRPVIAAMGFGEAL